MTEVGTSSDSHIQEFRIALFGPQVTHWRHEELSELQSNLLRNTNFAFLITTLLRLRSFHSTLEEDAGIPNHLIEARLDELRGFAAGDNIPDPQNLSQTVLAPLTVLSQIVNLARLTEDNKGHDGCLKFQVAQGFCIGFLSAAALASSSDWAELEQNASNAVRLAFRIGTVIDAEDLSHAPPDRAVAVSARWKTASDRTYLETSLDLFPNAYVSCITDDRTLTVTLPDRDRHSFCAQLSQANIKTSTVGLHGCYHHSKHTQLAEALKKLCAANKEIRLPNADKLRLPLRSTADTQTISTGALHEIAIDLILCTRAHWYQTVKRTVDDLSRDNVRLVPLGKDSIVPHSILLNTPSLSDGLSPNDDNPSSAKNIEEVAVVGMACRFPQADSLEEFWQLLNSGETSIGKLPIERFNPADVSREPRLAKFWGNFLRRPDAFDHRFFGISGREAKSMDPQQRLALQVAYEAIESSGYCSLPTQEKEVDVGCYLGVGSVDYEENVASDNASAFSATGTLRAFISGRISHFFGWTGPSITFDTACSSSAVAIHTASKALLAGECSMALAGGVNVITSPNLYQNLSAASFLNPNGSSKAFDAEACGYCRGEGAGILTLKLLSRAKADGDTILGVIAGSAVNQGSNSSPITVPDSQSQNSLYRRALSIGRIEPSEVTYVEAHGTGTPVGDPIEYESVRLALTGPWRTEELFLGSVKDNVGHTGAASGAAAVIKSLLMMQYKTIPKQANFASLNPRIAFSPSDRITVPRATQEWKSQQRVALINNYGAAGSNVAIALREHSNDPLTSSKPLSKGSHQRASATYPILLSARSPKSLELYINALKSCLPKVDTSLGALAYNIFRRQNSSFEHRATFIATDTKTLASVLNSSDKQRLGQTVRTGKSPVVLCFGGQTGRTVTISRDLYDGCDLLRYHLNECNAVCQTLGLPTIFPNIFHKEPVEDIVSLHCILLSVQISSARCWIDCGVEVDTVIGHSFGQLSALCVAGSISLEDTFRLVTGRSHLLRETWGPERGIMLSVECDRDELHAVLNSLNETAACRVDIACYNGSRSFVLAGDTASMAKAENACQYFKTVRLHNNHAYHSYVADGILSGLNTLAESINIQTPRLHVETCSTGESWSEFTAREVVQHTRQPVYFAEAVERIAARLTSAVWLEAGSTSPIIAMTRRIVRKSDRSDTFIPMDLETADATANLANATSQLWKAGCAAHYWLFHRSSSHHYENLNLPPYQFDESRHWIQYKPKTELPPKSAIEKPTIKAPSLVSLIQDHTNTGEHLFSVDTANAVFDLAGRGHAVAGQSLCPASMYLELATRCAMEILGNAFEARTYPHIESLTMSAPLGLGGESDVFLHLHETARNDWQFTVFSGAYEAMGTANGNTEHAKGRISLASVSDAFAENRLRLLQKFTRSSSAERILNSPLATGMKGTIVYKLFSDVVDYASYYHGVKSVTALEHEAVGFVTVPAEHPFGMEPGYCDPISLDNFLQVAGIHVNCLSNRKEDEVFMCTVVEEIIFSSSFITKKSDSRTWIVFSRYEIASKGNMTNDIFVYEANSKELVLVIMGANFRSVPFKSLVRSLTRLNIASTAANKPSDSDSDSKEDSGYQSRLHTPPDEESKKQTLIHTSLSDRSTTAPLPRRPQPAPTKPTKSGSSIQLVRQMFSDIIEIPVEEIEPTSTLDDLGIDSLLVTEVLAEIQKRFQVTITQDQLQECGNVLALCHVIQPDEIIEDGLGPVNEIQESSDATANFANTQKATAIKSHHSDSGYQGEVKDKLATISRDCFDQAKSFYDDHARTTGFTNFCTKVYPLQSELVLQYVVAAFASLGCDLRAMKSGDAIPTIQYLPVHQKLIRQLYGILEAGGLIEKQDSTASYRTEKPLPISPTADLHAEMLDKFPKHASETKLLHTTASRLAECLSGAADPLGLMFRDSTARALMEDVYTNAPMFKTGTLLLAEYLSSILERFSDNRKIRILELGAGTGGTTKDLVEKLVEINTKSKFTYTFTDLSSSLVAAARRKFAKWPFMQYTVLDIEKDPAPQFTGAYDIIVSTNCIHATKDLLHSTTNICKMLRPDGVLCLVELTRNLFWFDLVFGLLEGWWLFNDGRQHALADERRWERCLNAAGFEWVDWSDSTSQESDILRVITASPLKMEQPTSTQMDTNNSRNLRDDEDLDIRQSIVFKNVDGLDLQADLYYPSKTVDSGTSLPVALMIHGGGHIMLSRNDMRPEQTNMLLKSGFLPISVDYRLCPETTLLEGPMTDVVDALAWIRNNLPNLPLSRKDIRVDTERVVAAGWSTGGHLAMSLAWTSVSRGIRPPEAVLALYCPTDYEDSFWVRPNIPHGSNCTASDRSSSYELDDDIWTTVKDRPITSYNIPATKRAIGGWLASSDPRSRLALYMNWHGRTLHVLLNGLDKKQRKAPSAPSSADIAAISPLAQIRDRKYQTPTFIIHPRQDDLIPWQQAQRTWAALRAAGVDAEFRILEDVGHLFDVERNWQKGMAARKAWQRETL